MSQSDILRVFQDAIYTVLLASAPMMVSGLVVGLVVSVIQATTQIHEQTLAFAPKIIAIFLALLVFGGFIFTTLGDFTRRLFEYVLTIPG